MNLLKYLQAAGVPETLQAQAMESLEQAREKAWIVSPYKWSAPLVMVGWKINNVLHNQHTVANVTWITWSMLRWKGEE